MPGSESKQAEKQYLTRSGSRSWEQAKPFSHAGADTLAESSHLLHDFAVAMLTLRPALSDLILDLGAGGCWCSDLLGRLNRRAVAVDISHDMLLAGRSRPQGASISAVAGDMEALPFHSGTFDKAICLSALHHVPDTRAAVKEIGRVLKSDGVALFSEPGKGHAEAPVAAAAVRDFGVLEREILVRDLVTACRDAGFRDVRLKPVAYVIPEFDLTLNEWNSWSRLAASKRPLRALGKIAEALKDLVGIGKQTSRFDETLGMRLVRLLRPVIETHPVIVASKAGARAASLGDWQARVEIDGMPDRLTRNARLSLTVRVTNTGAAIWRPASEAGTGHVKLGIQLLDSSGHLLARDYHRVALPHEVAPGGTAVLVAHVPAPADPATYRLKLDLVSEGVTWFEQAGSHAAVRTLVVE
jgi:ubiquinone/menaquinone biosynthesis C-methylase UbiE